MVFMFGSVVSNIGYKNWFQPNKNIITNIAARLVLLIGINISKKNLIGLQPSIRAASTISSGIVIKNCLKRNVAVADAIKGKINPA